MRADDVSVGKLLYIGIRFSLTRFPLTRIDDTRKSVLQCERLKIYIANVSMCIWINENYGGTGR